MIYRSADLKCNSYRQKLKKVRKKGILLGCCYFRVHGRFIWPRCPWLPNINNSALDTKLAIKFVGLAFLFPDPVLKGFRLVGQQIFWLIPNDPFAV